MDVFLLLVVFYVILTVVVTGIPEKKVKLFDINRTREDNDPGFFEARASDHYVTNSDVISPKQIKNNNLSNDLHNGNKDNTTEANSKEFVVNPRKRKYPELYINTSFKLSSKELEAINAQLLIESANVTNYYNNNINNKKLERNQKYKDNINVTEMNSTNGFVVKPSKSRYPKLYINTSFKLSSKELEAINAQLLIESAN
eukprot:Pgem_evm1s11333